MTNDLFILIFFSIIESCIVFMIRHVLYDFLRGSCSKKRFRLVMNTQRSIKEKITLEFIYQFINEDSEKKSFRRYQLYYLFSMILIPIKLIFSIVFIYKDIYTNYIYILYAISLIIHVYVVFHEETSSHFTIHAGRKYVKNKQ